MDIFSQQSLICSNVIPLYFRVQIHSSKQHMNGLPETVTQFTVEAVFPGIHPDRSVLQLDSRFTDVSCPSLANSAVISNVTWPSMRVTRPLDAERRYGKLKKRSFTEFHRTATRAIERSRVRPVGGVLHNSCSFTWDQADLVLIEQYCQCFCVTLERVVSILRSIQESASWGKWNPYLTSEISFKKWRTGAMP